MVFVQGAATTAAETPTEAAPQPIPREALMEAYDLWIQRTFGNNFVGDVAMVAVPATVGWVLGWPKLGALVGVGLSLAREHRTGGFIQDAPR